MPKHVLVCIQFSWTSLCSSSCLPSGGVRSFPYGQLPWLSCSGQRFPRHNSLSGKNTPVKPRSSDIVWDDSELGQAYCLDVFVVRRNVGISSLKGIFRSLCEFSRALHNAVRCGVPGWGLVWESVSDELLEDVWDTLKSFFFLLENHASQAMNHNFKKSLDL